MKLQIHEIKKLSEDYPDGIVKQRQRLPKGYSQTYIVVEVGVAWKGETPQGNIYWELKLKDGTDNATEETLLKNKHLLK